ncbi:ANK_REP_REGION domain-containing protein [Durusdinium trenchii]|uniref:ANK_REP_REGION domain-containing protein n=1 Tax=Durusdinium trenchii TaxID=1381693 RepID=A0ABP0I9E6_9DINO
MAFRSKVTQVRNGQATRPNVPEAWRQDQDDDVREMPMGEEEADSLDEDNPMLSSQNSEEFHRNVAPKKNNLTDVLSLLKDGRGNSPEPEKEEEDQGQITSSDAAASDENLAPMSKPWEWDFTNKRRFKLTTKQLRRMFSPRKLSGHNPTSSRRSTQRTSTDESTEDFDHEELSSFTSEDNDEWIEEFVQAPERRDSWRAPGSLEEQRLLRVTNDDLQEACLRGDLGLVKRLISARASVNAPMRPQDAPEFMTLLHVLARKPHMQNCSSIIAEMVRNKANLNVRSSFGTTPLSLACHAKHTEAVEVLLRAKASADPVDDFGRKAPLYAILPPWDPTLVDNTEENLTVKTVQLLARARTNLDDGGASAPIVEAVCHGGGERAGVGSVVVGTSCSETGSFGDVQNPPAFARRSVGAVVPWSRMSKALERVQSALKADQQRHQQRQRGGKVPTQELSLLDDVELPKKHRFRDLVLRILTVNRSLKLGIQRSNLKEWHELSKFRPASEEDHKVFMANVLNNFQLMARFSRFLRQAHDHAFKAEEEFFATGRPIDSEEFLKMIAIKLHEAKVSTAHLCWHEFVKPLRVHRVNLEAGVESLKTQLRQLRSEYLKEISTLRDSQRHRQDPLEGLADLRYFYEPLHSLEPTEQEFMVNLIREVLRMMMDSTDGKQKISSSVLERFVSEVHENEVKALKDEVTQKNWQLKQMKQAQNFLETQLLKNTQSPNERTAGSLEKMLQVTEEQLSHVRGAFYDLQKEEHRLRELCESSTAEQKEMAERLEQLAEIRTIRRAPEGVEAFSRGVKAWTSQTISRTGDVRERALAVRDRPALQRLNEILTSITSPGVEEDQKQMIQSLETEHIELKALTRTSLQSRVLREGAQAKHPS